MSIDQEVQKFHDSHKDLTGPDAGTKISEDLFKATQGLNAQQKKDFYIGLDHSDSVYEKVGYDFKDTNNDGVRDAVIVSTQYDAYPNIPGFGLTFQKTNAMEEMKNLVPKKESMSRGSDLENGFVNVVQTREAVKQNFDKK